MDLHQETFRLTDGPEKKHMDVQDQLLAANCPTALLISPGHFENAILSEFNICSFLLRASNVDDLDHLEKFLAFVTSTVHSIAAVSSSVSSNLAKWTISEYLPLSVPGVCQLCSSCA